MGVDDLVDEGRRRRGIPVEEQLTVLEPQGAIGRVLALRDPESVVRGFAARGLTRSYAESAGLAPASVAELLGRAAGDQNQQVRINALRSLAEYRDSTRVRDVLPLLDDPFPFYPEDLRAGIQSEPPPARTLDELRGWCRRYPRSTGPARHLGSVLIKEHAAVAASVEEDPGVARYLAGVMLPYGRPPIVEGESWEETKLSLLNAVLDTLVPGARLVVESDERTGEPTRVYLGRGRAYSRPRDLAATLRQLADCLDGGT